MNSEDSGMAASAICFAADMVRLAWEEAARNQQRPSVVLKPTLMPDGTMWCALYGENLQEGVAGFGETPSKAMFAFDVAWESEKTPAAQLAQAGVTRMGGDLDQGSGAEGTSTRSALADAPNPQQDKPHG